MNCKRLWLWGAWGFCVLVNLAGCTTTQERGVGAAVITPLSDLNLVRADIPKALQEAQKAPYGLPVPLTCEAVVTEIHALDEVLGADLDAPASDKSPSLLERGGDAGVNSVKTAVEGAIPFRGWIRKLTGAERYSRQVAASITAGAARRGFLKGVKQGKGC
jgi:hypothetical protein